jgi:hypothetical protein
MQSNVARGCIRKSRPAKNGGPMSWPTREAAMAAFAKTWRREQF